MIVKDFYYFVIVNFEHLNTSCSWNALGVNFIPFIVPSGIGNKEKTQLGLIRKNKIATSMPASCLPW